MIGARSSPNETSLFLFVASDTVASTVSDGRRMGVALNMHLDAAVRDRAEIHELVADESR